MGRHLGAGHRGRRHPPRRRRPRRAARGASRPAPRRAPRGRVGSPRQPRSGARPSTRPPSPIAGASVGEAPTPTRRRTPRRSSASRTGRRRRARFERRWRRCSRPSSAATRRALADGFVTSAAVLRHLQADPLLPDELLPARWPGAALRADYDRYDAAYRAHPPHLVPRRRPEDMRSDPALSGRFRSGAGAHGTARARVGLALAAVVAGSGGGRRAAAALVLGGVEVVDDAVVERPVAPSMRTWCARPAGCPWG